MGDADVGVAGGALTGETLSCVPAEFNPPSLFIVTTAGSNLGFFSTGCMLYGLEFDLFTRG